MENNNLKSENQYTYEISINKSINENCFIKVNVNPENIKKLVFYIQYKYYGIVSQAILKPYDIALILEKCYSAELITPKETDEIIDLYLNFKENCYTEKIDDVMNDYKTYDVKGLTRELRKIVDMKIEMWR